MRSLFRTLTRELVELNAELFQLPQGCEFFWDVTCNNTSSTAVTRRGQLLTRKSRLSQALSVTFCLKV